MEHTFLSATILLLLVTDPLGNIPIFIAALRGVAPRRRRLVIARECSVAFGLLLVFLFFGERFMRVMHLSDVSLQIGGGIILFLIALRMVFPNGDGVFGPANENQEPFIVPLAIPAMAGPSSLATVMLLAAQSPNRMAEWAGALGVALVVSLTVLVLAERLQRALGNSFITALERLMGLVLTAIAVEMVLAGLRTFLGTLTHS
jgi:MarC family membrane protein